MTPGYGPPVHTRMSPKKATHRATMGGPQQQNYIVGFIYKLSRYEQNWSDSDWSNTFGPVGFEACLNLTKIPIDWLPAQA